MASTLIAVALASLIAAPTVPAVAMADTDVPLLLVQQRNGDGQSRDSSDGGGRVDCRAAAGRALGQTGGQLLSARPAGGSCVVTVLVPGKGNERPRKMTVRVPAR